MVNSFCKYQLSVPNAECVKWLPLIVKVAHACIVFGWKFEQSVQKNSRLTLPLQRTGSPMMFGKCTVVYLSPFLTIETTLAQLAQ